MVSQGLPTVTRTVTFRETVAALNGIRVSYPSPVTGRITDVLIHFPLGCNSLVQVAFGHEQDWTVPTEPETYIALDNATPLWPFTHEYVRKRDRIWVYISNGDAINAHTISVIATLEGVEKE